MRKPKNIDDLSQCVKEIDGKVFIYCVECEKWQLAAVQGKSNVLLGQDNSSTVLDFDNGIIVCPRCLGEVEYLLNLQQKNIVFNKIQKF